MPIISTGSAMNRPSGLSQPGMFCVQLPKLTKPAL
jgi:hypothetical protein